MRKFSEKLNFYINISSFLIPVKLASVIPVVKSLLLLATIFYRMLIEI